MARVAPFAIKSSPPSRRRGLKFNVLNEKVSGSIVASFAEAWIEIIIALDRSAPLQSPPSRRRGLKFVYSCENIGMQVASFAEAWIEIFICLSGIRDLMSPPSRRRGLKSQRHLPFMHQMPSPPSRRRGLKLLCNPTATSLFRRLLRGGVD